MKTILCSLLNLIFDICFLVLIVRMFLVYIPHNKSQKLIKIVYRMTDPFIDWIEKGLPPQFIGFDASPLIAMILLYLIQQIILRIISII
jgi:YggT family protein